MLALRSYQVEAMNAVLDEWCDGRSSTLLAMATGCGKTIVFLSILAAESYGPPINLSFRGLILAHREELIQQPLERMAQHFPGLEGGAVMAGRDDADAQIVVGTVQTLARPNRLFKVLDYGPITHVVIDEAHHTVASSYREVLHSLRHANPLLKVLGVTATPQRADGRGLSELYQSVAYRYPMKRAIKEGALVPFQALAVQLGVSFADVAVRNGDYAEEQAGRVMSAPNALELIVEAWKKNAAGRPTLAFASSVEQARAMSNAFENAGVASVAIDAKTDSETRAAALRNLRSGRIQVLANCALFLEGTDLPEVSCLVQARPTRQDSVYVQMAGRVLRPAPGKTDALILDYVPMDVRDLTLAGDLLGRPKAERKAWERAEKAGVILESFGVTPAGDGIDADPDEVRTRMLDYLSAAPIVWTWHEQDGIGVASLNADLSLMVKRLPEGGFGLAQVEKERSQFLGMFEDWEQALERAEAVADDEADPKLSARHRQWRAFPPTDKQKALLEKFGVWREDLSRGEASQLLDYQLTVRRIRQHARAGKYMAA